LNNSARRYTMTPGREGGVGIDFVTPNDPRLPRIIGGASVFDNSVPMTLVRQGLYGQFDSIPVASGIEARLIEAEAQLQPGGAHADGAARSAHRQRARRHPLLGAGVLDVLDRTPPRRYAPPAAPIRKDRSAGLPERVVRKGRQLRGCDDDAGAVRRDEQLQLP